MAKEIKVALVLDTKNFDKGLKSASSSMSTFKGKGVIAGGAMAGLAARLVPLAAGLIAIKKGFDALGSSLRVSSQFEDVGITLSNIIGSAEGGAAALNLITKAAEKLPFAFEDLAGAAPALATVSDDLGELEDNMMLAADIAGNFGIPFDQAASTLQRAFSGGAGAADVFREKGVLAAAGFEAGVTYSIEETQKKLIEFGGTIEGAAQKLNESFSGAVSQSGDRLTLFNKAMGDAFRPEITSMLNSLVASFDKNKEAILEFATAVGRNALKGMIGFAKGIATVIDLVASLGQYVGEVGKFIKTNFGDQIRAVANVVVKAFGLIVEGTSLVGLAIGKVIEITTGIDSVSNFFDKMLEGANKLRTDGLDAIEEVGGSLGTFIPVTTARDAINTLVDDFTAGAEEVRKQSGLTGEKAEKLGRDLKINLGGAPIENAVTGLNKLSDAIKDIFGIGSIGLTVDMSSFFNALDPKQLDAIDKKFKEVFGNAASFSQDTSNTITGNLAPALAMVADAFDETLVTASEYSNLISFIEKNFKEMGLTANEAAAVIGEIDAQFAEQEGLRNFLDQIGTATKTLSTDLVDAFSNGESAGDSFKKFFSTLVKQMIADILRLAILQPILASIMAPFGFGFGAGGNVVKIPGKANGGSVMANRPYIVGEKGPELFIPGGGGTIVPNGQMGGGTQVTYNINAVDSQSFQMALAKDPSFVFAVTEAGRRKQPGRI